MDNQKKDNNVVHLQLRVVRDTLGPVLWVGHDGVSHNLVMFKKGLQEILAGLLSQFLEDNILRASIIGFIVHDKETPRRFAAISEETFFETSREQISMKVYQELSINMRDPQCFDCAIPLLIWHFSPRFNRIFTGERECVICKKIQRASIDVTFRNKNIAFPSDHCLDHKCLSHEINWMIDPKYVIPSETLEHGVPQGSIAEAMHAGLRQVSS